MKRRIIINIQEDEISDIDALAIVELVARKGRISETAGRRHYSHLSIQNEKLMIHATKRTDSTDTFTIYSR